MCSPNGKPRNYCQFDLLHTVLGHLGVNLIVLNQSQWLKRHLPTKEKSNTGTCFMSWWISFSLTISDGLLCSCFNFQIDSLKLPFNSYQTKKPTKPRPPETLGHVVSSEVPKISPKLQGPLLTIKAASGVQFFLLGFCVGVCNWKDLWKWKVNKWWKTKRVYIYVYIPWGINKYFTWPEILNDIILKFFLVFWEVATLWISTELELGNVMPQGIS